MRAGVGEGETVLYGRVTGYWCDQGVREQRGGEIGTVFYGIGNW